MLAGALMLGYTVFPISPRNSPAAVAALLLKTKAADLFLSSEPALQTLAELSLTQLDAEVKVRLHAMPSFDKLYGEEFMNGLSSLDGIPLASVDLDSPAMIFHSSGD